MSETTEVRWVDIAGNRIEIQCGGYCLTFALSSKGQVEIVSSLGETDITRIPRQYVEPARRRAYAIFQSHRAREHPDTTAA